MTNASDRARSRPPGTELRVFPSSQKVEDPPPSRFIASAQPSSAMNPANSREFIPIESTY
jgi:hypothetical protein